MCVRKLVGLFVMIGVLSGCVGIYRTPRVHIPHQTKAKQLQVEAAGDIFRGLSGTVDASYSLTDYFVLSAGGTFYPVDDLKGFRLGGGFLLNTPFEDVRFTATSGVLLQRWRDYQGSESVDNEEEPSFFDELEFEEAFARFETFDATVFMPHAQAGLIFGNGTENASFIVRAERPTFDFKNVSPIAFEGENEAGEMSLIGFSMKEQVVITSAIIQVKSALSKDLSAFFQVRLLQRVSGMSDNAGFAINNEIFDDLYLGVSYLFGN